MIEFSPADRLTAARSAARSKFWGQSCVTCYSFRVELCYVLQLLGGAVLRVTAFAWSCVTCYSFLAL